MRRWYRKCWLGKARLKTALTRAYLRIKCLGARARAYPYEDRKRFTRAVHQYERLQKLFDR